MAALTYDNWTELLGRFFFDEAHDGEEILFAVDEVSLAEVTGLSEEEASSSLAHCVRLVIGPGWNVHAISRLTERWERAGRPGDHPALPFLALTVLAASRMGGFEGFAPHKFYVPLRRALVADDPKTDTPGTYLDHVQGLWSSLSSWANVHLGGARGVLNIQDAGRHYGRGLAVQHALVKSYDLTQLDAFFRAIGLEPGEQVAPAELLRALRVWTAGKSEPWAGRLHRICSDPDLLDYAQALLSREARRWDGRPRDPRTGRAVGRLRVGFNSAKRPEVGLFAQFDERLPESVSLDVGSSGVSHLHRVDGWYEPHPLVGLDLRLALMEGADLRGGGLRFVLRADGVYALSYDDDLGAWVSVDGMSFGDRYHLLVRTDLVSEVVRFAQACSTTDSLVDEIASRSLPTGWKLVVNVRLDARPKVSPPSCLSSLIPVGSGPRLRLVGGLPLTSVHGVYLRGGEPALALSTLCDDERISITRESTGQVERFRITAMANREISLWKLQLEPDRYRVQHGESSVLLQIVDGIADEAGPGAGSVTLPGHAGSSVVGTTVYGYEPIRKPLTVPAPEVGQSLFLLGSGPDDVLRVDRPKWLSAHVGFDLSWKTIDAWPSFDAVWLLMKGASGRYEASLLKNVEPRDCGGAGGTHWARLLAVAALCAWESPESSELWERYCSISGVKL